jgi:hypothetical protein
MAVVRDIAFITGSKEGKNMYLSGGAQNTPAHTSGKGKLRER